MKLVFQNDDLIGMKAAAAALGVSAMTLHRWIAAGKITAIKVGSYRAIPKDEIARLRQERQPDGTSKHL